MTDKTNKEIAGLVVEVFVEFSMLNKIVGTYNNSVPLDGQKTRALNALAKLADYMDDNK